MIGLGAVLGFGAWYATGWVVAAVICVTAGVMGPMMWRAPRQRREFTDEIEAYSQWTEQIRDLVAASGSLFETVTLSADQAPSRLRPTVVQMASIARTVGLPPALDWFASEMKSPFADRLVLGMKIAWDSGARVSEAFESTAKAMRSEVEMRRRNEVANARAWTQVISRWTRPAPRRCWWTVSGPTVIPGLLSAALVAFMIFAFTSLDNRITSLDNRISSLASLPPPSGCGPCRGGTGEAGRTSSTAGRPSA